ncbi:MAG: transcriptional repressor [Candidatus Alcyoniella australis]|nr:transcriptional repressor [Candidatus Alcyoniella australis]
MYSIDDATNAFKSYLAGTGKPFGLDREAVLLAALDTHEHFTHGRLVDRLREANPEIMPDLVQMALGEMVRAGLIRKVFFGEGPVYYEHVYGHLHHDHLVCVRCGELIEFRSDVIEAEQRRIAEQHGFRILRHSLQIMGVCERCSAEPLSQLPEFAIEEQPDPDRVLPLSLVRDGLRAQVVQIEGGSNLKQRLTSLGLTPGDEIEVCHNTFAGPFVIKVKGSRIALGRGMVDRIQVRRILEPAEDDA